MPVSFVKFDATTGDVIAFGQCQEGMVEAQARENEIVLETNALSIDGWRKVFWDKVKVKREERYNLGVMTPFGRLDTKPESRDFITGIIARALVAVNENDTEYSRGFTKADDTQITLNAEQIKAAFKIVDSYIDRTHQHSQQLRLQINNATSILDLVAVEIEQGWPE